MSAAAQPSRGDRPGGSGAELASAPQTLRVQAVFVDVQERHADAIAAEMIARAHELANLPEWECDVDVDVRLSAPDDDDAGAHGERAR